MLKLPLYQDLSSLWSSFDRNKELVIVCPSPLIADAIRKKTSHLDASVQTMAGFSQKLAADLNIDLERFKRKSELLFSLSVYAQEAFKMNHQEFLTAFNVFTELRGVSSDIVVIESVLEEYLPKVKEWVLAFYEYIDTIGWLDEHGLYESISSRLDEVSLEFNQAHIFYGFNHLTGSQIDLIKKIARSVDVSMPYRQSLYDSSWPTDWISWFDMDAEKISIQGQLEQNKPIPLHFYTDTELGLKLKHLFEKSAPDVDILLAQKNLEPKNIMNIPHDDLSFKISYDFFELEFLRVKDQFFNKGDQAGHIISSVKTYTGQLSFETPQEFKKLKILSMLIDILKRFPDDRKISDFDWKIIAEVIQLDIPRLNITSFFTEESHQHRVVSLSELDDPDISQNSLLVLSSDYMPFKGASDLYSEQVEKYISSISPMRRSSLEDEMLLESIREVIIDKEMQVLVEHELLDREPKWLELIQSMETLKAEPEKRIKNDLSINLTNQKSNVEVLKNSEYFSATRLQTHIDCDLLYFYKYVDPIFPNYSFETEVEPRELGSLEHEVIAAYCEKYSELDLEVLKQMSIEILDKFLATEQKRIDPLRKSSLLEEIIFYSQNGIQISFDTVKAIQLSSMPVFERKIKEEFPGSKRSGAIDFSYFEKGDLVLIDFKRGGGGIPSAKEITEFEKIQFLFYLNLASQKIPTDRIERYFLGYLCLSDIEKSMLWADEATVEEFKAMGYPSSIFKRNDIIEDFKEYPEWEQELINKIQAQEVFQANPRKKETCQFCDLKNICTRGIKQ